MRTYLVTIPRVFCVLSFLSSAALTGCLSSGAKPPGANAPCTTDDNCPSGYQCFSSTSKAVPWMSRALAALAAASSLTADPAVREVESFSPVATQAAAASMADLQPAAALAAHLRAAAY